MNPLIQSGMASVREVRRSNRRRVSLLAYCGAWPLLFALSTPVRADAPTDSFLDLDIRDVLNLEVTSVSRKSQPLANASAAVTVLTQEDIRRSGAYTLPDILRLAPGMQVGQISANAWAVSARGANGRFASKLQVMLDGRSVYLQSFSGVLWDELDILLEDIDRIEIIRGPGATLWGANAVNGIINIISREAAATQGALVSLTAAKAETGGSGMVAVRQGGATASTADGNKAYWRVFGKTSRFAPSWVADTGNAGSNRIGDDSSRTASTGFRADLYGGNRDNLVLDGRVYRNRISETAVINICCGMSTGSTPPTANLWLPEMRESSGAHLMARWRRELSAENQFTLQTSVAHEQRWWPAHWNEHRNTLDTDFQFRSRAFAGHEIVAGFDYRVSSDTMNPALDGLPANTVPYFNFKDPRKVGHQASVFIQDDIELARRWVFTLGLRADHHDVAGTEYEPNLRLLWRVSDVTNWWAAVARAVRNPYRGEGEMTITSMAMAIPTGQTSPYPTYMTAIAPVTNYAPKSERMIAYETGLRHEITPSLSTDLTLYYYQYDQLRRYQQTCVTPTNGWGSGAACGMDAHNSYAITFQAIPDDTGKSYGGEFALKWQARPNLRLEGWVAKNWLRIRTIGTSPNLDRQGSSPGLTALLRAAWNPTQTTQFDAWLRRMGTLPSPVQAFSTPVYDETHPTTISGYNELDLRLAWRIKKDMELALSGRNLLHAKHPEYASDLADIPVMETMRQVAAQAIWRF